MESDFTVGQFLRRFPSDSICLEEIKRLRFPGGIHCKHCKKNTKHYRLSGRPAYLCEFCRGQVHPLVGTIFEKTSTSLRLWFYALFLMTQSKAGVSIKSLQRELGVTYKTAWKMYKQILKLMEQNNGDLLAEVQSTKWVFFNRIELKIVRKKQAILP
jgi:transposase